MTLKLNEFRELMNRRRQQLDQEARALKNSQLALNWLKDLYRGFDPEERAMAGQVLSGWVLSEDETLRYDALALIGEFGVREARLCLIDLARRLESSRDPGAPYESIKVKRVLQDLK